MGPFLRSAFLLFLFIRLCPGQGIRAEAHPPAEAEARELLAGVCSGEVEIGQKPAGLVASCKTCPAFTANKGGEGPFTLRSVTYGSFSAPLSRDALLDFNGCDGPRLTGGSAVVNRTAAGWRVVRYEPMAHSSECQKYRLKEQRDILICQGGWTGQGADLTTLYTLDMAATEGERFRALLGVSDNAGACPEVWKVVRIEKMALRDLNYDAMPDLLVFVSAGKKALSEAERKKCLEGVAPPESQVHRVDFLFNGKEFLVAPWSAETKKMLEDF